ncbi:hypothetical protein EV182_004199 [Spiromyces aspiralis]|uniref:Uncharacterized protein n=1 Tax=Spiromyces aspiralis TaxID=68401 RepID=A0ACC1HVH5_9FUNG|nr:hypothetical protein EV182_004199 [Spiromyces aspiralis]
MVDATSLAPRIREILQSSDLDSITSKRVQRQLEAEMGIPLANIKEDLKRVIVEEFKGVHHRRQQEQLQREQAAAEARNNGMMLPSSVAGRGGGGGSAGGDDGGEPPAPRKRGRPPKAGSRKRKRQTIKDPNAPKRQTGLSKPMKLSPKFQAYFKRVFMPRTQVVKGLWAHIKENNLQDSTDKRYIICDDVLKNLFDTDRMFMYTMNKMLNDHLSKPAEYELAAADAECGTSFYKASSEGATGDVKAGDDEGEGEGEDGDEDLFTSSAHDVETAENQTTEATAGADITTSNSAVESTTLVPPTN